MSTKNLIVLIPDTTSAAVLEAIAEGTYEHADLIRDRVAFGRPVNDSQAFSFQTKELPRAQAMLWDHPEVTLVGIWDRDTGEADYYNADLYLEIMPDIVDQDEDGNEISRVRPTEPSQVGLWGEQADRQL
jgi:hypothetical protein